MSPYRALAKREPDLPRPERPGDLSGARFVAFLWFLALAAAFLQSTMR